MGPDASMYRSFDNMACITYMEGEEGKTKYNGCGTKGKDVLLTPKIGLLFQNLSVLFEILMSFMLYRGILPYYLTGPWSSG